MRLTSLIPILLLAGACAETTSFEPTENVSATGHQGQPAAGYNIGRSATGAPYVHVNVWSDTANLADGHTNFTLSFEIRDTGRMPVSLDQNALALEVFDTNGRQLPTARVAQLQAPGGTITVQPNSATTIRVVFVLPARVAPDNIATMRLRWGIIRADGLRYTQFTAFQQTPQYAYYPSWGYYDPFFYSPWFWGPSYYPAGGHIIVRNEHVGHYYGHAGHHH